MTLEEKIKTVTVSWDETTNQYKVSEPNWKGGEVVLLSELKPVMEEMKEALQTIASWNLPDSGHKWDDGEPMSYGVAFGSNGERNYMKIKAEEALSKYNELFKK